MDNNDTFKLVEVLSYGDIFVQNTDDGADDIIVKKWQFSSGVYLNGYTLKRSFKDKIIICKIKASNALRTPLFIKEIYPVNNLDKLTKSFSCTNPTAACKKVIQYLKIPLIPLIFAQEKCAKIKGARKRPIFAHSAARNRNQPEHLETSI